MRASRRSSRRWRRSGRAGYRQLHLRLVRDGTAVNVKRIHRVYRAAGLVVRSRKRRKRVAVPRVRRPSATARNERWGHDFVTDALRKGRPFPALTVVDEATHECLAIAVGHSLASARGIAVLVHLALVRGRPQSLSLDNGPEFIAVALTAWAEQQGIEPIHIQPRKPAQNAYMERFNQTYRREVLDANVFVTLTEVRVVTKEWLPRYNTERPHDSLGRVPPLVFLPSLTSTPEYQLELST